MQGLWAGFSRAVIWKEAAATYAGPVAAPDLPAEIADQLMRLRGVIYAIACGFHEQVLYISARIRNSRKDAGRLLRRIIGRSGSAGGHGFMAGGQVCVGPDPDASQDQAQAIICRFMKLIYPGETPPAELQSLIDPKSPEPNNRLHAEC